MRKAKKSRIAAVSGETQDRVLWMLLARVIEYASLIIGILYVTSVIGSIQRCALRTRLDQYQRITFYSLTIS